MRLRRLCALSLLAGCGDHDHPPSVEAERDFRPLVELEDWAAVARADDPFVDAEDPPPACDGDGFIIEEEQDWLEMDTGECSWVTLGAAARGDVAEGQELRIDVSHFDLDAAEPATATLRLSLNGCEAWSNMIAIPSSANVYQPTLASPCAVAQGAQVLFHLHNHGQNTYQLRGVSALR